MAGQTSDTASLDREHAADRLEDIAEGLRRGEDFSVRVGNKDISLTPPESVDFRLDVVEKQRRFRGNRETVRIEIDWKPPS